MNKGKASQQCQTDNRSLPSVRSATIAIALATAMHDEHLDLDTFGLIA